MPKIKVPRKNISLDMTAMCDVAFLLLTFFMLATKFKPEQKAVVDIPSSQSELKIPEQDLITIAVQKDGAVIFSLDGQHTRMEMLDKMSEKYKLKFSSTERAQFASMEEIGLPLVKLKSALNLDAETMKKLKYEGVPCDSTNNELADWLRFARESQRKFRFAIKGDKDTDYPTVEKIIGTLQDLNVNKFNLITTLEK
jgi:biopolymer transport protein ExbD